MNIYDEIMLNLAQTSLINTVRSDGDYEENGLLYCGKCRTPKQSYREIGGRQVLFGQTCECEAARLNAEKAAEEEARRRQIIEYRREKCIGDAAYRRLNFAADNGSCPKAVDTAKWYCGNFAAMLSENKGLLFMGTVGTGKTFAACCIANELVERGYDVWLTIMLPLLRSAGDFAKADSVFERVAKVDLLVLDDFGTTKSTERSNELLFEIIDTRARSGKPLIVTTNLSPEMMKQPDNLALARVYDRVIAMCSCERSPVILNGGSIRAAVAREKHAPVRA